MAGNSFGRILRLTSYGESHGPGLGGVLDGCPAGLPLSEEDLQRELDLRKPGQGATATKRKESDTVRILSGVFQGLTTGTPIAFHIAKKPPSWMRGRIRTCSLGYSLRYASTSASV